MSSAALIKPCTSDSIHAVRRPREMHRVRTRVGVDLFRPPRSWSLLRTKKGWQGRMDATDSGVNRHAMNT